MYYTNSIPGYLNSFVFHCFEVCIQSNGLNESGGSSMLAFKAMLHEAIFLATCLASMTTEKHCKLQRGCHTFAIYFFATCNAPAGNCLQLFLCQLEISCEPKTGFDCLIFTKLRGRLRWTCQTQQLVLQRCEKLRIFLLFLQLATQHFVKSFLQLVSQRLL